MGVTIHYSGKLDDPCVLPKLLLAARQFCFERGWKYEDIDERILGAVEHWILCGKAVRIQETPIDDSLYGILIVPHPSSEPVWLTFNHCGELCFYAPQQERGHYWEIKRIDIRTQFAPLDVHISVCELLHLVKSKYLPNLAVDDEGEYWETGDAAKLARNIESLNGVIERPGALQNLGQPTPQDEPHAEGKAWGQRQR